jgi:Ice-binding-like/Secretion system C-terminal sorting domain
MKTRTLHFFLTISVSLFLFNAGLAQAPNLRSATNYVLFTGTGAVGNTGISQIIGDVGTNNGAITGFDFPTTIAGAIDSGNAITVQCAMDLQAAYDELFNTAPTSTSHTPAFGGGETLFAGVYEIAAAGSVAGDLTLDAQWNSNAVFIFKFGGAFTSAASSNIHLINGASACNVFWGAEGAIALAAVTTMKGTLIANNGAISMGANGELEGRLFSTTGAASIYQVAVTLPCSLIPLPVDLVSFAGSCNGQNVDLNWTTGSRINYYFIVERSVNGIDWEVVGTVVGSASFTSNHAYTLNDKLPLYQNYFYRLRQNDINGNIRYGNTILIKRCGNNTGNNITIYPNPSKGRLDFLFTRDPEQIHSIKIFNARGQKVYETNDPQSGIDLSGKQPGLYFLRVQLPLRTITLPVVVE